MKRKHIQETFLHVWTVICTHWQQTTWFSLEIEYVCFYKFLSLTSGRVQFATDVGMAKPRSVPQA